MKRAILLMILILVLPSILAIDLKVEKLTSDEAMIMGLNKPTIVLLNITNNGVEGDFSFYTFFGAGMDPKEPVRIKHGETKQVELKFYPREDFESRGFITFDYYIRLPNNEEQKENLMINVVDFKKSIEVGASNFNQEANSVTVYVKDKVNFDFGNVRAKLSSPFFTLEKDFQLPGKTTAEFIVNLNREDFKQLIAGFYTIKAEITVDDKKTNIEGVIEFKEKNLVTQTEKTSGFLITARTITNVNSGNIIAGSETSLTKNIFSRLLTSFNVEPDFVTRKGAMVYYSWTRELKPGETFEVVATTNWLFFALIIILIVGIIAIARKLSKTHLVLKKRVAFVKAKGGEFALKVSVIVTARRYVERITIIDRIPPLVKIHERFGVEQPKRVDEKNRKLEWTFEKLEAGESRVMTYILYSKVGVLGKFALPPASAIFEREGKIREAESNQAFLLTEQRKIEE